MFKKSTGEDLAGCNCTNCGPNILPQNVRRHSYAVGQCSRHLQKRRNKDASSQQLIVSLPSKLTQGSSAGHGVRVQPEGDPRHDDKQDAGDEVVHDVVTHLPGQVEPHCQRAVVTTCNDRTHCRRFGECFCKSKHQSALPKYTASRFRTQ